MTTAIVYEKWKRIAATRGWKLPVNDSISQDSWVTYWIAMDEYQRKVDAGDPDPGRPVVPHRSAADLGIVRPPAVPLTPNRDPVRAIEVSIAALRDIVQRHPDVLHDFDCDSFIATELEPALRAMQSPAATSPIGDFADVVATYDDIVNRLDRPDPEADFVMRGSDWRTIRPAIIVPAEVVGATPRTDARAFLAMSEGELPAGCKIRPEDVADVVPFEHQLVGPCVQWKVVTVALAQELERTCDAFMRIAHSHSMEITRLRAKLSPRPSSGALLPDGDLEKPAATDEEAINRIDNCFTLAGESVAAQDWARVKQLLPGRLSQALVDVIAERTRQIEVEGWTHDHDDFHDAGELAKAGGTYALHAGAKLATLHGFEHTPPCWPWDPKWWKPKDPRRDLVRATALTVAEIERMDRDAKELPDACV